MSSDFECPQCHGDLWNPCDPGCCQSGYCSECDIVYGLRVLEGRDALHYKTLACQDCHTIDGGLCKKHMAELKAIDEKGAQNG